MDNAANTICQRLRSRKNLNKQFRGPTSPQRVKVANEHVNANVTPVVRSAATVRAESAARDAARRIDSRNIDFRAGSNNIEISANKEQRPPVLVWSAAIDGVKAPMLQSLTEKAIVNWQIKYTNYTQKLDRLADQHGQQA